VQSRKLPVGRISISRAGGLSAERLFYISDDGKRLSAEVEAGPLRRVVRLAAGNGSQLEIVHLWQFRPVPPGVLTVFVANRERLLVNAAGPEGSEGRPGLALANPAVVSWVERRAPGIAALVAEARDLVSVLVDRTVSRLSVPNGYAFSAAPLLGLEILVGPPAGALLPEELSIEILSSSASQAVLARFQGWRHPTRSPMTSWRENGRIVGGKDEKLGGLAGSRDEEGVETAAVLVWDTGRRSETLRMSCDAAGVVRATIERGDRKGSPPLLALETVAGAPGTLGMQPWILESTTGRRSTVTIPSEPEGEAARARQAFLDETEAAFRAANLPPDEGARMLWRWYRILDSEKGRALLPELAGLADLLATMHAPPYGTGPESAWAGAVSIE